MTLLYRNLVEDHETTVGIIDFLITNGEWTKEVTPPGTVFENVQMSLFTVVNVLSNTWPVHGMPLLTERNNISTKHNRL